MDNTVPVGNMRSQRIVTRCPVTRCPVARYLVARTGQ